ncbi:UNVERIFIED_CONTAM: hypothetical protein RKD50_000086 [Streptomyces canus]
MFSPCTSTRARDIHPESLITDRDMEVRDRLTRHGISKMGDISVGENSRICGNGTFYRRPNEHSLKERLRLPRRDLLRAQ